MTQIFNVPPQDGGVRILILGGGTYPFAKAPQLRVPVLPDISSATQSAVDFALRVLGPWRDRFEMPLASVDLLANAPGSPDGITFTPSGEAAVQVEAPTLTRIKAARKRWMDVAGARDILLFYCCGHGIWLPSAGRTFLTTDFGEDPENPWGHAIGLDDFSFALGERAPRRQWLIFDCCTNTPSEALKAMAPKTDSLISSSAGEREAIADLHGPLTQVVVQSATPGAQAFGKHGRASRFMEALLEACDHSAFVTQDSRGAGWWVDQHSLERSISTYAVRVAASSEETYFRFARVTQTDAVDVPRLIRRDHASSCTLLVKSQPAIRLTEADLEITCPPAADVIGGQTAGPGAQARYRQAVDPWRTYRVRARFPTGDEERHPMAIPPLAEASF